MKLSLKSRIFIILAVIAAVSLLILWKVLRPKYEAMAVAERLGAARQLQAYAIRTLDRAITDWTHDAQVVAAQVSERPKEGETVLRTMMALRPEIIQIKIHSSSLSDELVSQNTAYPPLNLQISDSAWIPSKQDSLLRIAWLGRADTSTKLFAVRTLFQVQDSPFALTVLWDAKRLNDIFRELPLGQDYSVSIQSSSAVIVHNMSSFDFNEIAGTIDRTREVQSIREETASWQILIGAFQSARLWMIIAIPEKTITGPVEELMLYSTSLVVGLTLILLILGWLLSHQARRSGRKAEAAAVASDR